MPESLSTLTLCSFLRPPTTLSLSVSGMASSWRSCCCQLNWSLYLCSTIEFICCHLLPVAGGALRALLQGEVREVREVKWLCSRSEREPDTRKLKQS